MKYFWFELVYSNLFNFILIWLHWRMKPFCIIFIGWYKGGWGMCISNMWCYKSASTIGCTVAYHEMGWDDIDECGTVTLLWLNSCERRCWAISSQVADYKVYHLCHVTGEQLGLLAATQSDSTLLNSTILVSTTYKVTAGQGGRE